MSRRPKTPLCECGRPVSGDQSGVKMCAVCLARRYNVSPVLDPIPSVSSPSEPGLTADDPDVWAKTVAASANDLADIRGITGMGQRPISDYEKSVQLWMELDREKADTDERDRQEREQLESQIRRQEADRLSGGGWRWGNGGNQ